jgi:hypothetical protein
MNKHKQSSGDTSRERCTYLANVPEGERIKAKRVVIRTGHIKNQIYRNVKMILNGEVIYNCDL